ncbi:pyrroline-5-carboxylate reductase [Shewanella dokdonensis]|uniref:Pyrroline-5-carboxylate reductase n=1 Tax=Shewanella dokdonensis TaxID=712036 RepID=A0ABX8DGP8_9GAMM|nr:pyrroline-5-carboxylate reductase [Shewanella dokdonensis]MCL1074142.1 pyrroline-5-carboxylate reductase [Shewanella dokdonensis]QVK23874.1 pyrroline-5-carboxylate reductase [Shewanella dokdonensis]
MSDKRICFIGAGNMSRSIISGLVSSGYQPQLIEASNPSTGKLQALQTDFAIKVTTDNLAAARAADVIVLAVKPQLMQQVCAALQSLDLSDKLLITIAAGINAARYSDSDYLAQPVKLIRTMPNTPMQIGAGMSGMFAPANISDEDKVICHRIMTSGGQAVWVDKEADLNLVIALAGSSPAYFFLFVEAMINAAAELGMEPSKARALAQQAALGAARMLQENPQLSPQQLRQNVTSKGGTTHEAVETFKQGELPELVKQAMNNCIARAEAMAKEF